MIDSLLDYSQALVTSLLHVLVLFSSAWIGLSLSSIDSVVCWCQMCRSSKKSEKVLENVGAQQNCAVVFGPSETGWSSQPGDFSWMTAAVHQREQIWPLMKQQHQQVKWVCSGLDSAQSVGSSQSKHVSAVRNSLHNEVSQPCNTVAAFWGTTGGSGPSQQRRGKAASSLAQPGPETSSHFCALLSSHMEPNRPLFASLICFVYQATWTCIWSAGEPVCQDHRQMDVH